MTRILLDVNVVLDVLLNREPHVHAASAVWTAVECGQVDGLLSAHAVTTIHYLNERTVGRRKAAEATAAILSVFHVAAIDEAVTNAALALQWKDFEDAVTAAAAHRARCVAVVTRNTRDFKRGPVRAITPEEAAAWLQVNDELTREARAAAR